jgi:adenylyltransferase/sulfurtransferase
MPDISARYSRFIVLRDIKEEGFNRIRTSKVVVVGIGGLGSISATKLMTLGIDTLRIVDPDTIEETNLQRQFLYRKQDVGKPKISIAARRLQPLNPDVTIEPLQLEFKADTADQIIKGMDVVVDGLDRFGSRFQLNRACVHHNIPYVFAGALGAMGNLTTIIPGKTPCLECIYGGVDDKAQPTTQTIGVYPTLLGVVANIQVHETIKLLLAQPPHLAGHLLYIDLNTLRFDEFPITRNLKCPVCKSQK